MRIKRKRRNFSFSGPGAMNRYVCGPRLSPDSVHLLAASLMYLLINEIISPINLRQHSRNSSRAAVLTYLRFDLLIHIHDRFLEGYVARFARNRGARQAASGTVGKTCPTFPPRVSRGASGPCVAEPRPQSRRFTYDAGQIDTAAGFPGFSVATSSHSYFRVFYCRSNGLYFYES